MRTTVSSTIHSFRTLGCSLAYIPDNTPTSWNVAIGSNAYSHSMTEQWTNAIVENLVRQLVAIDREYKYVTTCMIVQKSGAGMRSATSCFWNAETDHGHSVTMEHGDMYVITTVFVCKA